MARGEAATVDELRDTGDASTWTNLNGLWEWEPTTADAAPAFGKKLAGSILVPFPVESCASSFGNVFFILAALSRMCVGIHRRKVLPSPVCA